MKNVSRLTDNPSCKKAVYITPLEVWVGWGEARSLYHRLRDLLQKLAPYGVFEGESVRIYLECISDRGVYDDLRPSSKWSLKA